MFALFARLPLYYLFRSIGRPKCLPLNLTLSITFDCNSRCLTCNLFKKTTSEMSLGEWKRIFASLGEAPFWVTISGGEPFLRKDLTSLAGFLYDLCHPSIINIPTNGLLTDRIVEYVDQIASHCVDSRIIINLSVDELGRRHDVIRGVKGNFTSAINTFHELKNLKAHNVTVGIHTVISKFNVNRIPGIYGYLMNLGPDSCVAEIAEERRELDNIGADISPSDSAYAKAADFLIEAQRRSHFIAIGKITRAFRAEYHRLVKRTLDKQRQVIPCYAGVASAHIAPNGEVWACCTKAESMGNLRDYAYDFKRVWVSRKGKEMRKGIREGRCWCTLANVAYTNMLMHPLTLLRVGWNYIMGV